MVSMMDISEAMERVFSECDSLRKAGQAEYAMDERNGCANFERVASDLGLTREEVLWVYLRKHFDGITSWIRGHRSQRESVSGRINDAIVYLVILRAMVEDSGVGLVVDGEEDPEWVVEIC